jgi:hypothetical protein
MTRAVPPARPNAPVERRFLRLGRFLRRRSAWVIAVWVVLLLAALPLLGQMSSATSPSTVTLPSSAPSQQAAALLAREFPGLVSPSSSLIVLAGRNVTGSVGQASTLALGQAILSDPSLKAIAGVSSLYSSYETYLAGETTLGLATLKSGLSGSPDPLLAINSTAALTWGVAETYTST